MTKIHRSKINPLAKSDMLAETLAQPHAAPTELAEALGRLAINMPLLTELSLFE